VAGVIPVLGIPVLSHPDYLAKCIGSIDTEVKRLVVIDNSPDGSMYEPAHDAKPDCVEEVFITEPPANLGFSASVNLIIRTAQHEPWWCIANADVEFGPGDLGRLAAEMEKPGPRWVGVIDWRVFGLNFECVERAGWWDENFHPAFCEDADYEYRCRRAGVEAYQIPGSTTHFRSITRTEVRYEQGNNRSYPANVAYYAQKWGGALRGGERFTTPFDRGGSVADWTLDIRRLRDNDWR
jgi:GT2 family glycosyltransferase